MKRHLVPAVPKLSLLNFSRAYRFLKSMSKESIMLFSGGAGGVAGTSAV